MRSSIIGKVVVVEMRRKSADSAARTVVKNWAEPPNGYRMTMARISRRGTSGRAVNLELRLAYIDDRIDPFKDRTELAEFFSDE